ncbi:potassium voltage-gated channel protein shaw-like [Plakobranchus ocellatus]|uniref:Potassium voltage-gated channel protein shaw-like n=1 Tax=Plakobranchus ocellatus TaxID=259542 RepID=A0AAV4BR30_9GAST|nr:potassium voltage-gated channel protein shaw-like [Plakobranchus ocellatus]
MEAIRKAAVTAMTNQRRNRRIKLNVGGAVFETWTHTLLKRPGTRLAQLARAMESDESYDSERGEYFFDRHPGIFATVMHYYRTEELHTDHNICGNIIKGELEFWGLTELDIEPCCWGHYNRFKENKETLAEIDDTFTFNVDAEAFGKNPSQFMQFKKKVWIFLEDPASSREAKIYAIASMFFVLLSIAVFVLETHHLFRVPYDDYNGTSVISTSSCTRTLTSRYTCCCRFNDPDELPYDESEPHDSMTYLDYICAGFFLLEYLARLFFAPKKSDFMRQPLNIIDVLCLLPHLVSIIMKSVDPTDKSSQIIKTLLALRIIRVLRIFKLMKHYTAFKILVYTIKVSTKELLLMVIFLFTGVLIFASVAFYTENSTFTNIPIGFWWALVTMTTVGYGDKVPQTEGGYVLGSLCVLCGVLVVAFTVPIVVNNFTLYYSHAQSRMRLPPPKREELQKKLIMKNHKAQEFIEKLTMNVRKTKQFNSLNAARGVTGSEDNNISKDQDDGDSGLEVCSSPIHNQHTNLQPMASTSTMCSFLSESPSLAANTSTTGTSVISSNKWSALATPATVKTVSARVEEMDLQLPGTPRSDSDNDTIVTARHIETACLLNAMEDHEEKVEQERRRQLDLMTSRSEQRRQARMTPRPSPAPGAAARPSLGNAPKAGGGGDSISRRGAAGTTPIQVSPATLTDTSPVSGSPSVPSSVSALSTKEPQKERKTGQLPTSTSTLASRPTQAFLAKFGRRKDDR